MDIYVLDATFASMVLTFVSQVSGFVVRNEVQPAKGGSLGMSVVLKSQPRCNGSTLMLQY